MRKLIIAFLSLLSLANSYAQIARTCSDEDFRKIASSYVSKGNWQYYRSYRNGIKLYADSLENALCIRSEAGILNKYDSLEFYADLFKLRGDWHYENGNYDNKSYAEAEKFFLQALSIYESNTSLIGPLNRLPIIQREMAQLLYKLNRYDEALTYTESALKTYVVAFDNWEFDETDSLYVTLLDLKSQEAMCLARTGDTKNALSIINELLKIYPKSSDGYYEILRKKGKILILSQKSSNKKKALDLYKQYFSWKKSDASKALGTMTSAEREDYWMRIRPFVADCYQLEDTDPGFLYDVTLFSKGLLLQLNRMSGYGTASEAALASLQHTWTDIQNAMGKDACAIEFVQYEKEGQQHMAALVVNQGRNPQWIQMMDPDAFYNYKIAGGIFDNRTRLSAIKTDTKSKRGRLYQDSLLCQEIWPSALVDALGQAKKIYFSPDGYFHHLAIEYMDHRPCKDAELFRLSSTRRLLEDSPAGYDAALIVGNVDYEVPTQTSISDNDGLAFEHVTKSHVRFSELKNSGLECQTMMEIRDCPSDTLLSGSSASEQDFLNLCCNYPMIIISTHGYFDEAHIVTGTDIKPNLSDESLSHSLLALAGINKNTADETYDRNLKDGILSAKEISRANMGGVKLAILSACQTGLGYITADGIYGIQRGFKNAGVDILIVSLWEVDNDATQLLILSFLNYLKEGLSTHHAFEKAREILADNDDAQAERIRIFGQDCRIHSLLNSYDSPYYKNAFIMIDSIE